MMEEIMLTAAWTKKAVEDTPGRCRFAGLTLTY